MSKFKIGFIIILAIFAFSGKSKDALFDDKSEAMMDPITYTICDDDGFVDIDISSIQADILETYDSVAIEEAIYVCTSTGAVVKFSDLSGTVDTELICDVSSSFSDIAVDEQEVIYVTDFSTIFSLDDTNCTLATVPGLGTTPTSNSLSFDTQGNMYFGGASGSVVYRFNSDGSTPPYVWHDFGNGTPAGDFVMLGDKMYIAWRNPDGTIQLFEVTLDTNFNYVSHVNLGQIPDATFGLASELGTLYGVSSSEVYKINLDTFTFDTIATNNFTYGAWYGAAGLHEAFSYEITSHSNLADANASVNPLPDQWTNTQQGGQTIYIRVENTLTGDFEIIEVNLIITNTIPELTTPTGISICSENPNSFTFDLTEVETELLQNVTNPVTVTYYNSEEDATANVSAVNSNYNTLLNQETIYVRVQNVDDDCFAITQFDISADLGPTLVMPSNLVACQYENNGIFTLTDVETELLQNNTVPVTVTYHNSMADADSGTNSINTNYQITPGQETIFVRVQNNDNDCFTTTQFDIILSESLQITTPNDITLCANQNNTSVDLSQVEENMLANTTQNVTVTYHTSEDDAANNTNAVSTNYTTNTNQDTIYVRVQDVDTDCFATTQFDITTNTNLNLVTPNNIVACENGNSQLFDLTLVENELLQNVTENVNVSYHASADDALNNVDAMSTNFTLTSGQSTIFIRVENIETTCFETTQFIIEILQNPVVEPMVNSPSARLLTDCYIDNNSNGYFNLNDSYAQIIMTGNTSYSLEFYLSEIDAEQEINSIDPIYYATNDTQEIFVTVTNGNGCKSITNFFVDPDCYETVVDIANISFPGFFTPNNDMANDTWNVRGISIAVQQTAIMYIFDRYGKLLFYFKPGQTQGWDGTYRGKPMPSNEYWYKFQTSEGQTFSGSFSLIR
ncbi:T9SS type B sorting domain-containing protein [Kordia algicida OT-1]|uniref:Uncharacterized protein n=1 Tax=Kordia algicida OT-1 TaxID=391587 RepID=A9DSD9_9FLAO|nr:T9SS type B sorting domain-containing protein [Kordia algicida]EDP96921.1 hypothetical protein KAOT1_17198 [Kordia algicida OT-1]